jgi:hypothetical protein
LVGLETNLPWRARVAGDAPRHEYCFTVQWAT